jgi:hypothetical protein
MRIRDTEIDLSNLLFHYGVRNFPFFGVSVATMVHEYGHLICSKLLGFGGSINSWRMAAVYYDLRPEGSQWTLFYLSGGLFQFAVFGLMSLREKDQNVRITNRMTAILGLIEGLAEPTRYFRLSGLGASMGMIVAFIYLAYELIRGTEK